MASVWRLSALCGARGGRGEGLGGCWPPARLPAGKGCGEGSSAGWRGLWSGESSAFALATLAPVETAATTTAPSGPDIPGASGSHIPAEAIHRNSSPSPFTVLTMPTRKRPESQCLVLLLEWDQFDNH